MWMRWLPWRFIVRRVARAHGVLDPFALLGQIRQFAQPSEVAEPMELVRAGIIFHARGLINSRVIQHNLDWVWPYWIERQFDPLSVSFVPRGFSITQVNLTHRNWTAVGLPDFDELPIIDPRGLVTPAFDGWSLDGWVLGRDGSTLLPSRVKESRQRLRMEDDLAVETESRQSGMTMTTSSHVTDAGTGPECVLDLSASAEGGGWAVVALRPYNPEGISFIKEVELSDDRMTWHVDGKPRVAFEVPVEQHRVSHYRAGDLSIHLQDLEDETTVKCDVGMATAAALFKLDPGKPRDLSVRVPLREERSHSRHSGTARRQTSWADSLEGVCRARVPDSRFQFLYEAALRTLVLHAPGDVYPGPYTYKRFWFRDATYVVHALLCAGLLDRAERVLDLFPSRQTRFGFFHSQAGEWDSNGEALWILHRFSVLSGRAPKEAWRKAVLRGGHWIRKKRLPEGEAPHAGLLPAGFSAEHLGPNDYYYWDDFWSIAGLQAAVSLARDYGEHDAAAEFARTAESLDGSVERSLAHAKRRLRRPAMPASPYRRMDAGAIGSLAAGYPLQHYEPKDPRLTDTAEFLMDRCFIDNLFFQDMIHSGMNAYLTLHVAQVLMRAEDPRYLDLMEAVADLASPTGQWPEAAHPRSRGGCMGDGQHAWAAAEWLVMVRNCFLREEGNRLILGAGVPRQWLRGNEPLSLGPAPTLFGPVTVWIEPGDDGIEVKWEASWHGEAPTIEVHLAGHPPRIAEPGSERMVLAEAEAFT